MMQYSQVLGKSPALELASRHPEPGSISDSDPTFSHHRLGSADYTVYSHRGRYHVVVHSMRGPDDLNLQDESKNRQETRWKHQAMDATEQRMHGSTTGTGQRHLGHFGTRAEANEAMYRHHANWENAAGIYDFGQAEGGKQTHIPF